MLKNYRLNRIIFILFVSMSVIPLVVLSYLSLSNAHNALEDKVFEQLVSIRDIKALELENALASTRKQVQVLSSMPFVISAMKSFSQNFATFLSENNVDNISTAKNNLKEFYKNEFSMEYQKYHLKKLENLDVNVDKLSKNTILMQDYYISSNPNSLGKKENLLHAKDKSKWSELHKKYHPTFLNYLKKYGYHDIFLIDAVTGDIVYSVFKEIDFATSLETGPFKNTNFANAYQESKLAVQADFTKIVDMEAYLPSYEFPTSFISSPIYDKNKKVGILVMQIPTEQIDKIMTNNDQWKAYGFGETGETYLVGPDYKMRSNSRFLVTEPDRYFDLIQTLGFSQKEIDLIHAKGTSVLLQDVKSVGSQKALLGEIEKDIFLDYRGVNVLSAYKKINDVDLNWAIMSEKDVKESFFSTSDLINIILLCLLGCFFLVILGTYFVTKYIDKSLFPLTEKAKSINRELKNIKNTENHLEDMYDLQNKNINMLLEKISTINAMSNLNHDNTEDAKVIFEKVEKKTLLTIEGMSRLFEAIRDIDIHTKETKNIFDKVEVVAKQTKIISVNASIRAAKENNKSFSVIANEMRELAIEGVNILEKTEENITASQELTNESTKVTNALESNLKEIQEKVEKTANLLDEINLSTKEQFTDLSELSKSVVDIEELQKTIKKDLNKMASFSGRINEKTDTFLDNLKKL